MNQDGLGLSIVVLLLLLAGLLVVCFSVLRYTQFKIYAPLSTESMPFSNVLRFRVDLESEEWVTFAQQPSAFRGVAWGRWGGPDDGEADGRSIEMHTMSEEKLLEASRTLAHLHTASADAHQAAVDAAADSAAADAAVDSFLQICAGCSMGVDRNQDWVPL